ncbi:hypothetical protein ILUMI_18893 [Ignelater luminosus]|uniref:Uncharacterized protein n=1 Tax=Ignelater luminosus TaxID=2038154 RepID=A0A8K0G0F7_IGNLU|nr:hypothetical protein ILUMI_18893 [Ignelater luminosus]
MCLDLANEEQQSDNTDGKKVAKNQIDKAHALVNQTITHVSLQTLIDSHPPLPDNYGISKSRLKTTSKVTDMKLLEAYDAACREWLEEGIIEEVKSDQVKDKKAAFWPQETVEYDKIEINKEKRKRPMPDD